MSIKGRLDRKDTTEASPGFVYTPSDRTTSPRKRDPAFTFGSSTRPPVNGRGDNVPGPGAPPLSHAPVSLHSVVCAVAATRRCVRRACM